MKDSYDEKMLNEHIRDKTFEVRLGRKNKEDCCVEPNCGPAENICQPDYQPGIGLSVDSAENYVRESLVRGIASPDDRIETRKRSSVTESNH